LRFVVSGNPPRVVADLDKKAPGRGASLHLNPDCFKAAIRRRSFQRAFKGKNSPNLRELLLEVRLLYRERARKFLKLAQRNRKLVCNKEAVSQAILSQQVELLLCASDARSELRALNNMVTRIGDRVVVFSTKQSLDTLLGCDSEGVVAVLDRGISRQLKRSVQYIAELVEDS